MTSYTLTELFDKRAEIAGQIIQTEKLARQLRADLAHVEATIRILRPGTELPKIVPKRIEFRPRYFKRGQLTRLIRDHLREHIGEAVTVVHVDAVLRMFRPNFKAAKLPVRHRRPTKSPYFRHGELTQRIFDALRERDEISSADVAVQAMRDKGLDPDNDRVTRTDFVRRVGLQLNAMQRDGKIERIGKGSALRWKLAI